MLAGHLASHAADFGHHGGVADRSSGIAQSVPLDSAMLAMRFGTSAIHCALCALPPADAASEMAMPLVRDFPYQPLPCSDAAHTR